MSPVGIDHQREMFPGFHEGIDKGFGILEMDVVVARAVNKQEVTF